MNPWLFVATIACAALACLSAGYELYRRYQAGKTVRYTLVYDRGGTLETETFDGMYAWSSLNDRLRELLLEGVNSAQVRRGER